jgi:type II secretory pathway pseudopilin PulG
MKRGFKGGQIWIETVIYTLISLTLIGFVLSYATPKIESYKDKINLEKTISFLIALDTKINEIKDVSGNKRIIDFTINKGELKIIPEENKIIFEMKSKYQYSEPGKSFEENGFEIITKEKGEENEIKIEKEYSYNITYDNSEENKTLSKSPTPYKIVISNKGIKENKIIIDISIN